MYQRVTLSANYLTRFGRHPEDWEKGRYGDPSMLTRDLTETQQVQVNRLETEIIYQKVNELKREKEWLKAVPLMGSDDEFEEDITGHVVRQYTRRLAEKDAKYLKKMKKDTGKMKLKK